MNIYLLKNGKAYADPFTEHITNAKLSVTIAGESDDAQVVLDNEITGSQTYTAFKNHTASARVEPAVYRVSIINNDKAINVCNIVVENEPGGVLAYTSYASFFTKVSELMQTINSLQEDNETLRTKVDELSKRLEELYEGYDYI